VNQQNWIAIAALIGFIVFITIRGEVPAYLDIVGFGSGASS